MKKQAARTTWPYASDIGPSETVEMNNKNMGSDAPRRVVTTIATASHFALAYCMAKSFLRHHENSTVFVLDVDGNAPRPSIPGINFIDMESLRLGAPQEDLRAKYTVFEFCNLLKPFLLEHLLSEGFHEVIYLDSDLYFTASIESEVFVPLATNDIVLTPHLCSIPADIGGNVWRDHAVIKWGVMNGGLVGVRSTDRAKAVLKWWGDRVRTAGFHRVDSGLNCDQKWLDLLPGFAIDLHVVRSARVNVAYWNLDERTLSHEEGVHLVNGLRLSFFHFSGFDPDATELLTKHWTKHTRTSRPDLVPVFDEYRRSLRRSSFEISQSMARSPKPIEYEPVGVQHVVDAPPSRSGSSPVSKCDVSVVIAARNPGVFLRYAVESVLAQEAVSFEVILVDDASTEDISLYVPHDPRCRILQGSGNGVSSARNLGLNQAKGEMVVFFDSDDEMISSTRLRDQLDLLRSSLALGVVFSGWTVIDEKGASLGDQTPWLESPGREFADAVSNPSILPSAMAFRSEAVRSVGGFDENLSQLEDVDLVLRLLRGWSGTWDRNVTTRYRRHSRNASNDLDEQVRCSLVVYDRLFKDPSLPQDVADKERVVRCYLHIYYAGRYLQRGNLASMADQLAISAVWSDHEQGSLVSIWINSLQTGSKAVPSYAFDPIWLFTSPEWKSLVRLRPLALLDRGTDALRFFRQRPAKSRVWSETHSSRAASVFEKPGPQPPTTEAVRWLKLPDLSTRHFGNHRSGWTPAIASLSEHDCENGVYLEPFVDQVYSFHEIGRSSLDKPWVGFVHNPANMPSWYDISQSPEVTFSDPRFRFDLERCVGLFTLSEDLRGWWEKRVSVPVQTVKHPTEFTSRVFSFPEFVENRKRRVVQLGSWLRKLHSVYLLPVKGFQRTIVHQQGPFINGLFDLERKHMNLTEIGVSGDVEVLPFLTNSEYDELLATNIVFIDLYGASANNAVIECIVRGTPLLINPLPAVREYLGDEYPFYFTSRQQAARKAQSLALIKETHEYLTAMDKSALSFEQFSHDVACGAVFQSWQNRKTS